MTGLPGFDDYLDNHGNPGIQEDPTYPRWAIEEQIDVTMTSGNPDIYLIQRVNGPEQFNMSFGPGPHGDQTVLIDGEYVDLGDDFIEFISIIDDYHEHPVGRSKKIRQEPYRDE
jgi:hypothetical protein